MNRHLFTLAFATLCSIAGCAQVPAFRAALPSQIDTRDKAIAIIGDLQQTSAFVRTVRRREDNAQPQQHLIADLRSNVDDLAALVVVGDLVFTARSKKDWAHFDALISPLAEHVPVLPAIGNHDYPCFLVQWCRSGKMSRGVAERFPWIVPGQAFSVSAGRIRLLFLDSENGLESQGAWLRGQLAAAAGEFAAALVFYHRPAFSNSIDRGAQGDENVQRFIVPVLNTAPLPTIAFAGHIHGYEHIIRDGVHHITTAGGGGPRGPMPAGPRRDAYTGPDCISEDGEVLRPFNYLLLRETAQALRIEVRGLCRDDPDVRLLDSIEVEL